MSTFTRIVVPTDFGSASERALDLAIAIAQAFDAHITISPVPVLTASARDARPDTVTEP